MKINEVVRVINDIAARYDVVGLTVAEPMPRLAIKIKNMLNQLPLLKQDAPPSPPDREPEHERQHSSVYSRYPGKTSAGERGNSRFPFLPAALLLPFLRNQRVRRLPAYGDAADTPCHGGAPVLEPPGRRFLPFPQFPRVPFRPPSPAAWIPLPHGRLPWWALQ